MHHCNQIIRIDNVFIDDKYLEINDYTVIEIIDALTTRSALVDANIITFSLINTYGVLKLQSTVGVSKYHWFRYFIDDGRLEYIKTHDDSARDMIFKTILHHEPDINRVMRIFADLVNLTDYDTCAYYQQFLQ